MSRKIRVGRQFTQRSCLLNSAFHLNTLIEKIIVHEAVKGEDRAETGGKNLSLYQQD